MAVRPKKSETTEEVEAVEVEESTSEDVVESKFDIIKKEIEDFAKSRGEVAKNITVTDNYLVTAQFFDSDGREVRSYSRKLED